MGLIHADFQNSRQLPATALANSVSRPALRFLSDGLYAKDHQIVKQNPQRLSLLVAKPFLHFPQ